MSNFESIDRVYNTKPDWYRDEKGTAIYGVDRNETG